MSSYLVVVVFLLCVLLFGWGLVSLVTKAVRKRPLGPLELALLLGSPVLLLVGVLTLPDPPVLKTGGVRARPTTSSPAVTAVAEKPGGPSPAAVSLGGSTYTPAQLTAINSDRAPDDADIAQRFAALDDLCPENGMRLADLLVNMQRVLKEKGVERSVPYLMEQLTEAQGGERRMACVETGAALTLLIENGM